MILKQVTLATALSLALAACGESNAPQTGTPSNPSAPAAQGDAAALKASAEKLLGEATQYAKDHKWELADKAVTELDTMKPKLPPEYGPKIDDLKKLLATAKAATAPGGIKLP